MRLAHKAHKAPKDQLATPERLDQQGVVGCRGLRGLQAPQEGQAPSVLRVRKVQLDKTVLTLQSLDHREQRVQLEQRLSVTCQPGARSTLLRRPVPLLVPMSL